MKKENIKEKNKVKEVPISIEQRYEDLLSLMKSMKCMKNTESKADMYIDIASKFSELDDYEEAKLYSEKCSELARKTEEEIKSNHYKKAENIKNKAKSAKDYKIAAEEYQQASGYLDADNKVSECEELGKLIETKKIKSSLIKRGVFIIALVGVIIISFFPFTRYYMANVCMSVKSYSTAIKIYNRLGNYKDSKEKIIESNYQIGLKLEEADYKGAKKAYMAAEGYKDSEKKVVNMTKLIISNSKPGDTVTVGPFNWTILDMTENEALLIKKAALQGIAYNETYSDITWEKSTIRQYLNTEFFNETFSETEQKNIIQANVDNSNTTVFGIDGGSSTLDFVFLLSTKEAEEYKSFLTDFKDNSWLRSPGNSRSSAAFMIAKGTVMDYGYMVSSDKFAAHPVIWFNLK